MGKKIDAAALTRLSGTKVFGKQKVDGPLTDKQKAFVGYMVDGQMTPAAAARAAGCEAPKQHGHIMANNPKVQHQISLARAELAKTAGIAKKDVLEGFIEAIDLARLKGDPMIMVAGWREVGKMCGYYEPVKTKLEVSVNGNVMVAQLMAMNDDQLLELAQGEIIDITPDEPEQPSE